MTSICPRCKGTKFVGRGRNRKPCQACNADAPGDQIVGAIQRLADTARGRKIEKTGRTVTTQSSRLGTKTTKTTGKKKAAKKPAARSTPKVAPLLPACETCGQRGKPLTVRRNRHVCMGGCGKAG